MVKVEKAWQRSTAATALRCLIRKKFPEDAVEIEDSYLAEDSVVIQYLWPQLILILRRFIQ